VLHHLACRLSEPKPRAPKGEGKGKAKRESADGGAAAAAAAAGEDADAAAADVEPHQAAPAAPAPAVAPVLQQVKHERGSSSPTAHPKPGQGFGGLGAHPFLAARTFGKAGGTGAAKKSSLSPKPESPLKQQAAAGAAPGLQGQQQQQAQGQEQSVYAEVGPSVLPGLNAQILAGFAANQANMEEDDYDDYDS